MPYGLHLAFFVACGLCHTMALEPRSEPRTALSGPFVSLPLHALTRYAAIRRLITTPPANNINPAIAIIPHSDRVGIFAPKNVSWLSTSP